MAGIYIHIPFCRQACHYCDFHFSTNLTYIDAMVDAICKEIIQRKNYTNGALKTIYFGGGTPSILSEKQLIKIFRVLESNFSIEDSAEITLEANPEDLDIPKSKALKKIGINRLSIGIQSFNQTKLEWMNRAHDSGQIDQSYQNAREVGFSNISLDLIYSLPDADLTYWESNLSKVVNLDPEHISLYGLTIEEKTVFGKWEEKGDLNQLPEESAAEQYLFSIDFLAKHNYIQYEVSNFGKKDFYSRHNHSYWNGSSYLGVGPGAHSYNGESRQINVRNNHKYIKAVQNENIYYETERLSRIQKMNEKILTSLRTQAGLDLNSFEKQFKADLAKEHRSFIQELIGKDLLTQKEEKIRLTPKGYLITDEIALRMFFPE